jgi:hypothetical protein
MNPPGIKGFAFPLDVGLGVTIVGMGGKQQARDEHHERERVRMGCS